MKKFYAILALAAGLLAGCATSGPSTPAQTVFAAKSGYAAVLTAAVAYESLPRCSATVPQPCSSPELVAQLRKADNTANAALDAAETAVRTPSVGSDARSKAVATATTALAALQALLSTLGAPR